MAKKRVKKNRTEKSLFGSKKVIASDRKVDLVVKNLILFAILFVASLGLYYVSSNELFINFFWLIALISGLLFIAFLIIYLIFLFLRFMKK